jgi:hypothetical protein
MVWAEWD